MGDKDALLLSDYAVKNNCQVEIYVEQKMIDQVEYVDDALIGHKEAEETPETNKDHQTLRSADEVISILREQYQLWMGITAIVMGIMEMDMVEFG